VLQVNGATVDERCVVDLNSNLRENNPEPQAILNRLPEPVVNMKDVNMEDSPFSQPVQLSRELLQRVGVSETVVSKFSEKLNLALVNIIGQLSHEGFDQSQINLTARCLNIETVDTVVACTDTSSDNALSTHSDNAPSKGATRCTRNDHSYSSNVESSSDKTSIKGSKPTRGDHSYSSKTESSSDRTTSKCSKPIPGDHCYNTNKTKTVKRRLDIATSRLDSAHKQLKVSQQRVRRLKHRIGTFSQLSEQLLSDRASKMVRKYLRTFKKE